MEYVRTYHSSYAGRDMATRRGFLRWGGLAAGSALAAGCAKPPAPVTTPVNLQLVGAADMNPDTRGRASPMALRVYALKTSSGFDAADFFALFEKDTATLGGDLIRKEEVLLKPGESHPLAFVLQADAMALGILAAYRDLSRAQWRQTIPLVPGQPLNLNAVFGARAIALQRR